TPFLVCPLPLLEKQKTPGRGRDRGFRFKSLAVTYSRMGKPTLPSALDVFTSEFGMGSGGSRPLWPPGKPVCADRCSSIATPQFGMIRPSGGAARSRLRSKLVRHQDQTPWVLYG